MARSTRMTGLAASSCILPPSSSVQSTGTTVTARTVAAMHGKRLREGERLEQLARLARQREHRNERQHDDRHREKHRTTHQPRRFEDCRPHGAAIAHADAAALDLAERILGDHDARVDKHADCDGNACQAHDVRRDAHVVHREERHQHRERKRQRDDQDRPQVHQEHDVREGDERDFFEQRCLAACLPPARSASNGRRTGQS